MGQKEGIIGINVEYCYVKLRGVKEIINRDDSSSFSYGEIFFKAWW